MPPTKASETLVSRFLRGLLSSIWLYFPSILFLVVTYYCFWTQIQGQDIMMAFAEGGSNRFRVGFFIVLGFWVYLNWFSCRIIYYVKQKHSPGAPSVWDKLPPLSKDPVTWFRYQYPRIAAYLGLSIIELAILQLPALHDPLTSWQAFGGLLPGLVLSFWLDYKVSKAMDKDRKRRFDDWLFLLVLPPLALLSLISLYPFRTSNFLVWMFIGVVLLHLFFIFYINRHRVVVKQKFEKGLAPVLAKSNLIDRILLYFEIEPVERTHFIGLVITSLACLGLYAGAVLSPGFAEYLGPLTVLLLGFSFLLALSNLITSLSVKWGFNLHFVVILFAILFSNFREIHNARLIPLEGAGQNDYKSRPALAAYLKSWLARVRPGEDKYDVWFVMSDGGASRSGYWTASVLGRLEDSSRKINRNEPFSAHLFSLAGTSGGEVGLTAFFSLLRDSSRAIDRGYECSAMRFLEKDYFSFASARLLGPDYFHYIWPFYGTFDRAGALERTFEEYDDSSGWYMNPHWGKPFSSFRAMNTAKDSVCLPLLFINTTRMQDGNPGLITNLKVDPNFFGKRIDVLDTLKNDTDISIATAAVLGARFPYFSPAGRINDNYFVDGGYFDNSGAGVTQELIRAMLKIYKDSRLAGQPLVQGDTGLPGRLRLNVLHITNSPIVITKEPGKVSNLSNDLFAPFKALIGAYDMQTAVNDKRLEFYLQDLKRDGIVDTRYYRVSLYDDPEQCPADNVRQRFGRDSSYSMNWFMSDTTKRMIINRLQSQPRLNELLEGFGPAGGKGVDAVTMDRRGDSGSKQRPLAEAVKSATRGQRQGSGLKR